MAIRGEVEAGLSKQVDNFPPLNGTDSNLGEAVD